MNFINTTELKQLLLSSSNSPLMSIYDLIDSQRNSMTPIKIRPSGLIEFMDHGLAWATKQLLNVSYGNSISTVIGTAVHKGAEYAYKEFLSSGTLPSESNCLIIVAKSIKKEYKWIKKVKRYEKEVYITSFAAYKRAKCLFSKYYPIIELNKSNVFSVEETISYDDFVDREGNKLGLLFEGSLDRIDVYKNEYCITDIKTAKKSISGKQVEGYEAERERVKELTDLIRKLKPRKTVEDGIIDTAYFDNLKELESNLKNTQKLKIKDSPFISNHTELTNKKTLLNKHLKAVRIPKDLDMDKVSFENYKLTIPGELKKIESSLQEVSSDFEKFKTNKINEIQSSLNKIRNTIEKLTEKYHNDRVEQRSKLEEEKHLITNKLEELQHHNDTLKIQEEHGIQIASYAILFELKHKKNVKYGKVERLVYRPDGSSYFKSYVFDLTKIKNRLLEVLGLIIDSIIAWKCDNISASLLFRHNPTTFRGNELTEILNEIAKEKNM